MRGSFGGAPDPHRLAPVPSTLGSMNHNTNAVSLRATQTLSAAVRNLVIIAAGQSNISNVATSTYSPTNGTALDNFNVRDGALYAAADPLIGCSNAISIGNPMLRLADDFATSLFDRVVIASIAVNGTTVADWESGFCSDRLPVTIKRLAARGIVDGVNVTLAVLWGQGESDTLAGTTQTPYTNSLNAVIAASRTAGFSGLWFVAGQTYVNGTTSAGIKAAQAAVVNHGSNVWAGPDADALIGNACAGVACRQGDNIHFSNAGSTSYAAAWKTAMALYGAPFA